jgi:hypothetical protein
MTVTVIVVAEVPSALTDSGFAETVDSVAMEAVAGCAPASVAAAAAMASTRIQCKRLLMI